MSTVSGNHGKGSKAVQFRVENNVKLILNVDGATMLNIPWP